MAKKTVKPKKISSSQSKTESATLASKVPEIQPTEIDKTLERVKQKLDTFKDKVIKKFDKYVMGIAILPPPKEVEEKDKDKINVFVLIDDTDSTKLSKEELKARIVDIIDGFAKDVDEKILPQVMILSELWNACYDGKYEILQLIAMSAIIYETGMLSAIKVAEVHKSMVLKKFEKYIVSYVLAGSLVQGKATESSDIDCWIVIDDTDVKKMTRAELKDKLRAIIIGMAIEAGNVTGVKNKLNIQVYILTDFWDSLKEANPVIFTLLRDGVPLFDRGMFMPWKQLLKMGRIKPSQEAIDMFMSSGDQVLDRVGFKLREIGMEDTFWAILTPSQAALMLYGVPPPTPRETPELMRELFVKKEKLLEEKYIRILENNITIRKELEHGTRKELTGKEIDKLVKDAKDYLQRIKKLFEEIQKVKEQESVVHIYDSITTVVRDVLKVEGVEKVPESRILEKFNETLIETGKLPANFLTELKEIFSIKKLYDAGRASKADIDKIRKLSSGLMKSLVEYIQRKQSHELERVKIRVKYNENYGEIIILGDKAFIVEDSEAGKRIQKADFKENRLVNIKQSSIEELEAALVNFRPTKPIALTKSLIDDILALFSEDAEILLV